MICFDCAARGETTSAVAICVSCGTALCMDHAVLEAHYLTWTGIINRVVTVETPARIVHCQVCAAALDAQAHHATLRERDETRR